MTPGAPGPSGPSDSSDSSDSSGPLIDVARLEAALERFADERDWRRYHSPKNLAMALAGEAGELVEIFQWLTEDESRRVASDPATARAVRNELADVLMYLVRLSSVLGVDLAEAVATKLAANAVRYPAPLSGLTPGSGTSPST